MSSSSTPAVVAPQTLVKSTGQPTASVQGSASPDGRYTVLISENEQTLTVTDSTGSQHDIDQAEQIAGYDWLPDSARLVYGTYEGNSPPYGRHYDLWIADVTSGEVTRLSTDGENFHHPVASPNGQFVAILAGGYTGDDCTCDLHVGVLELDPATLDRKRVFLLGDFQGVPAVPYVDAKPIATNAIPLPGKWRGPSELEVALVWPCTAKPPDGIYSLDLSMMSMQKVDEPGNP